MSFSRPQTYNRWLCFSLMSLIKCYIKRFMLTVSSVIDKNIMQQLYGSLILQSTVLLCSCSPFSDLTWEVYKNTMLQTKVLFVTCCSCSCIEFWMLCENSLCGLCTVSRWLDHDCSQWSLTESFHKAVIGCVCVCVIIGNGQILDATLFLFYMLMFSVMMGSATE